MSTDRDADGGRTDISEGQRVKARYRGGEVEGQVIEVRAESPTSTRVVIDVGGDVELDTDAGRIESVGRSCRRCGEALSRANSYRCPACGADLVATGPE